MHKKKIICRNHDKQPITGYVEFVYTEHSHAAIAEISSNGEVEVPTFQSLEPKIAVVKPTDGHWPVVVDLSEKNECFCPPMSIPDDLLWWRNLPFGTREKHDLAEGIKVGVIDSPARRCPSLQHVEMYDIEGRPINEDTLGTNSHGLRVSAIIGERGQTEERRGIAPLANVTLIDVTDDDMKDEWDYSKIAPAIQILVDEFDVDIINISGGCTVLPDDPRFEDASLFFAEALDYAAARGVIVVAATGNDPSAPVALPARLDDAVGVGAIGLASVAPTKTRTKAYEAWALDSEGCTGTLNQHTLYHFKDTSFGDGLDMVGPGIGVVMTFEDGSFVEYDGTSYAAPYVTAVAACSLSLTECEPGLQGRPKKDMRKSHIELLCVDLGMSSDRQGFGIPVLMSSVGGKVC